MLLYRGIQAYRYFVMIYKDFFVFSPTTAFCGAQPLTMKNTKKYVYRFAQSFIAIPLVLATSMSPVQMPDTTSGTVEDSVVPSIISYEELPQTIEARALAIDTYYAERDMPLAGYGKKMVEEALKNDIDWRLLPAISVRESTGGKNACKRVKNSHFGFGSCKINFKSVEQEIEIVARNLGGNNPKTAHHYDDKTTKQILEAYNPPSVVPTYAKEVMKIMDRIGKEIVTDDIV